MALKRLNTSTEIALKACRARWPSGKSTCPECAGATILVQDGALAGTMWCDKCRVGRNAFNRLGISLRKITPAQVADAMVFLRVVGSDLPARRLADAIGVSPTTASKLLKALLTHPDFGGEP